MTKLSLSRERMDVNIENPKYLSPLRSGEKTHSLWVTPVPFNLRMPIWAPGRFYIRQCLLFTIIIMCPNQSYYERGENHHIIYLYIQFQCCRCLKLCVEQKLLHLLSLHTKPHTLFPSNLLQYIPLSRLVPLVTLHGICSIFVSS